MELGIMKENGVLWSVTQHKPLVCDSKVTNVKDTCRNLTPMRKIGHYMKTRFHTTSFNTLLLSNQDGSNFRKKMLLLKVIGTF